MASPTRWSEDSDMWSSLESRPMSAKRCCKSYERQAINLKFWDNPLQFSKTERLRYLFWSPFQVQYIQMHARAARSSPLSLKPSKGKFQRWDVLTFASLYCSLCVSRRSWIVLLPTTTGGQTYISYSAGHEEHLRASFTSSNAIPEEIQRNKKAHIVFHWRFSFCFRSLDIW